LRAKNELDYEVFRDRLKVDYVVRALLCCQHVRRHANLDERKRIDKLECANHGPKFRQDSLEQSAGEDCQDDHNYDCCCRITAYGLNLLQLSLRRDQFGHRTLHDMVRLLIRILYRIYVGESLREEKKILAQFDGYLVIDTSLGDEQWLFECELHLNLHRGNSNDLK